MWFIAGVLSLTVVFDLVTGSVRLNRFLVIDKEDNPGGFVMVVGLKIVAVLLIVITKLGS